jgi:hypothetical protein
MLDSSFVAAVLKGFEGTLDEVVERIASPELRADLGVLQTHINALRVSIEPPEAKKLGVLPGALVVVQPSSENAESWDSGRGLVLLRARRREPKRGG